MVPNSIMSKAASALTAVGRVLVLANWYAKPEAALAWTAALAMFAVMFAALMMGIPLALTLARSYGVVDDPDAGRRCTGVLTAA